MAYANIMENIRHLGPSQSAFRKKSKVQKHILIDAMLRSGFVSSKRDQWRSRVCIFPGFTDKG